MNVQNYRRQRLRPLGVLIARAAIAVTALASTTAVAQSNLDFHHPPALAPADATSSGAAGPGGDDEAAKVAELAKKLSNPVANLISVPVQYNYDEFGDFNHGASVSSLNIQPIIPFVLNEDWNLITRTIVPFFDKQDFPVSALNESGLGDIFASQFFSPSQPTSRGWIWGAGPIELLPAATEDALGTGKWGLGPTGVALKQTGPWTFGMLANHVWSVAGDDHRADISTTSLQPFIAYTTKKTHTTFGIVSESTYDWKNEQWSVPLIPQVAQIFKIGPQIMQLAVGAKYWAEAPAGGPEGWGYRVQLTFLFPK
jgi:hypothetical protein